MPMNPEVKDIWLEALRSGEYRQTTKALRDADGYCCLGVLCDLHAQATGGEWYRSPDDYLYHSCGTALPPAVIAWAGVTDQNPDIVLPDGNGTCLAQANDSGYTFAQIADLIEEQL